MPPPPPIILAEAFILKSGSTRKFSFQEVEALLITITTAAKWRILIKTSESILIPQNKCYEVSLDKEISYKLQHA